MTLPGERLGRRVAERQRETAETVVAVRIDLDGSGRAEITTGIGFLDHLLTHLARHGGFDLRVHARGDRQIDEHHTTEDVAIVLGQAFLAALGDRAGIRRMGHSLMPMDDVLVLVAIDLSGRGKAVIDLPFARERLGELSTELIPHFLETFALEGRLNLHCRLLVPGNAHHQAEAAFKGLARALSDAVSFDPRRSGQLPSTKEYLEA
ncbi:MAG: imidazoleglycerol-phosphate dehydratase HisB [Chloroflexi bacterium]|nr:imidazoleglycerol-phosphate dehydratase HisB [Chloroflexota bacterium]GIW10111.1 MAG: imidazoleglycerol-phosphate dehydratase [Dehalococcoidia bacterium]